VCDVCKYDNVRLHRRKYRKRFRSLESEPYTNTQIAERDGWRCQLCKKKVDRRRNYPDSMCATIDHIVPISLGGTDVRANVQLAHWSCNVAKSNKTTLNGEQLRLLG
jgi:5-methylcytosine-specific restriction endonuclease McrA